MTEGTPTDLKMKVPRYEVILRELGGPCDDGTGHGHPREVRFVTEDFTLSQEANVERTRVVGEETVLKKGVTAFSITGFTVGEPDV